MKWNLVIILGIVLSSCTQKNETPAEQDSLLTTPLVEHIDTVYSRPDSTGLTVDSFRIQQERDAASLARFTPKQILEIYEAYWPLRNTKTTQVQLNALLTKYKITEQELHSILAEGDRLGWAKAHSR